MGTFFRPVDLQRRQEARFREVGTAIQTVHKELVKGGSEDFDQLTSGSVTTRQLRLMGHPFGRTSGKNGAKGGGRGIQRKIGPVGSKGQISGKGVLAPLPINRQSGRLRRGKFVRGPRGSRQSYDIGSSAPYEPFILSPTGTSKMVARGYFDRVKMSHKARIKAAIQIVREKLRKP